MAEELAKAEHDQQQQPIPQLSNEDIIELDEYARALATIEALVHQMQLLSYRHVPNIIHNTFEQVINPTNDNTIPNQDSLLQPALQIQQLSIQRIKEQIQLIQSGATPPSTMPL